MQEFTLFQGCRVKLSSICAGDGVKLSQWSQDSGFLRNLNTNYAFPRNAEYYAEEIERNNNSPDILQFGIRTVNTENLNDNDLLIGFVRIKNIEWNNRSGQLELAIGEKDFKNIGLGSEIVQIILDYSFNEINLNRIEVGVASNNIGAIRMFEKTGFCIEGVAREAVIRDGVKLDKVYMSILAKDWIDSQQNDVEEAEKTPQK